MPFRLRPPDAMANPPPRQPVLPLARLAVWFALSRVVLWIVAGLALACVPPGDFPVRRQPLQWLNHWDAGWYLSIAEHGYRYLPHAQSNAAFFPLYPLLARGLSALGLNLLLSGYLLSNGFLFACCVLLWKLIARDYGSAALADRAVLFLLLCPLTVFYSSFYTESLFLFLALATAYLAGARQWLGAGVGSFLAALTRPPGALLALLIAFEFGTLLVARAKQRPVLRVFRPREVASVLVALVLPFCSLAGFSWYLISTSGDPAIMLHVHENWSQHMIAPWNIFASGLIYHAFYIIWFYAALAIGLALTILGLRFGLRPSHAAMMLAFMLLYCTNSLLEALPRYLSVVFPFYIVAGELCLHHPRLAWWLLGLSAALAVLSVVLFVDGYWFT